MIKLHEAGEKEMWINPNLICLLRKTSGGQDAVSQYGRTIISITDSQHCYVNETPEEVLRLIARETADEDDQN